MKAARGRKPRPQLAERMTLAAQNRLLVFFAAHTARLYHARAQAAGRPITWVTAIERAIANQKRRLSPEQIERQHAAVERQIFPRARDRKDRQATTSFDVVIRFRRKR